VRPGVQVTGKVIKIGLFGQSYQGTIVYPVTIEPTIATHGSRWGLTAKVDIAR
jgi:hypothetical protein